MCPPVRRLCMTDQKQHRDQTTVGSFIIMSLSRPPLRQLGDWQSEQHENENVGFHMSMASCHCYLPESPPRCTACQCQWMAS
jgi:hypothetical protein